MNQKINHILGSESGTRILIFIFMLSVGFIMLLQFAAAEDWLMFRHDLEHIGETSDVIENPGDLELKWKFQTGGEVHSSPAVSGDYVYFGSYDGYVYCLNKNTGDLKWKFETGKGVWSSPAVSGDYVYIGSLDNHTYCIDKNTGELKWKFETGWEIHSSPAVSGDYVYIGSLDTNVYCLNKNTGELKWKFTAGRAVSSSPAVSGDYVYIGSWDNYVYCLDKNTGELKWKFKTEWAVSSSQAFSGDYIYVGSEDSYVYCLNKNTGELKWKFKTEKGFWSSPAISRDHLYVGSNEGYVYCLNKDTGEVIWKFETGGMYSSPAVSGDYIYVGSYGGDLYCLNKNTGELTWKFKAGGSVDPSPAISGDYVYIGSEDGYVYAFTEKIKTCPYECCVNLEGYTNKNCSGDDYACMNNKCVKFKNKEIGENCSMNSECERMNCYKGICKEPGAGCIKDSKCSSTQYCSCKCPENTQYGNDGCVKLIDDMESTGGWNKYVSEGSQINITNLPGKFNNAIKMDYNLKDNGWVVISKNIDPEILSGTEGIRFYYKGTGEPNTIEFKLMYTDESYANKATFAFLKNKANEKGEWTSEAVPLNKFKCVSPQEICKSDSTPDISKIRKIEIAVSKQQGDSGGPGTLIIDDIYGMASESCDNGVVCLAKKPINASCSKDSECESGNCSGGLCKKQEDTDLIWVLIICGVIFLVIGVLIYYRMKKRKKRKLDSLGTKGFESNAEQLTSRIEDIKNEGEIKEIEENPNKSGVKIDKRNWENGSETPIGVTIQLCEYIAKLRENCEKGNVDKTLEYAILVRKYLDKEVDAEVLDTLDKQIDYLNHCYNENEPIPKSVEGKIKMICNILMQSWKMDAFKK